MPNKCSADQYISYYNYYKKNVFSSYAQKLHSLDFTRNNLIYYEYQSMSNNTKFMLKFKYLRTYIYILPLFCYLFV